MKDNNTCSKLHHIFQVGSKKCLCGKAYYVDYFYDGAIFKVYKNGELITPEQLSKYDHYYPDIFTPEEFAITTEGDIIVLNSVGFYSYLRNQDNYTYKFLEEV